MPLLFIFALLLLPAAEVYLLFQWFGDAPGWALAYLLATMAGGVLLMKLARAGFGAILQGWRGGAPGGLSPWSFILLGKMWFVGALLLFPGYLTDVIALLVVIAGWFVKSSSGGSGGRGKDATIVQAKVIADDDELR